MPKKKRSTKKKKKMKTKKKRPVKRKVKKAAKKKSAKRRKAAKKAIKAAKAKLLGTVVHYYDRIGVAIVELKKPLTVGEAVTFMRGDSKHSQKVNSMQIDHTSVAKAKKGDVVGVKVTKEVRDGAKMVQ